MFHQTLAVSRPFPAANETIADLTIEECIEVPSGTCGTIEVYILYAPTYLLRYASRVSPLHRAWSQHSIHLDLLEEFTLLRAGVVLATSGPFHGVILANSKGLSSPADRPSTSTFQWSQSPLYTYIQIRVYTVYCMYTIHTEVAGHEAARG